jgi:hypothetical protein
LPSQWGIAVGFPGSVGFSQPSAAARVPMGNASHTGQGMPKTKVMAEPAAAFSGFCWLSQVSAYEKGWCSIAKNMQIEMRHFTDELYLASTRPAI